MKRSVQSKAHTNINKDKKRVTAFIVFVVSVISVFTTQLIYAKDLLSVGVVNVPYLMEHAPQAKLASKLLKKKFIPQEKKLADALDEINELSQSLDKITDLNSDKEALRQRERELRSKKRARSRLLQDFREELRFARDSALDDVQREVFSAIDKVREKNNIDIILQDYLSASQRVDVTPLVLKYLKQSVKSSVKKNGSQ